MAVTSSALLPRQDILGPDLWLQRPLVLLLGPHGILKYLKQLPTFIHLSGAFTLKSGSLASFEILDSLATLGPRLQATAFDLG